MHSPSAPPEPAQYDKCHACHAECASMSPSATPAAQSEHLCRQVPRLPLKTAAATTAPNPAQACHRSQPSTISALSRRMHVHVAKCHTCHAKWTSMSPSATPATQTAAATTAPNPAQARHWSQPSTISSTPATQNARPCMSPSATPATQLCVADKLCVWVSCVWSSCVWTSCVWASCVDKLCVVKLCVDKLCVDKLCVDKLWQVVCVVASCVWVSQVVCEQVVCVCATCVWASCVVTSCMWTSCAQVVWWQASCVWASCVWTSCAWTSCVVTSWAGGGRREGGGRHNQDVGN